MIRAVVFDAVGTVMNPSPPVADVYKAALAQHCQIHQSGKEIGNVVRQALNQRSEEPSLQTDEGAEREFWWQLIQGLCGEHPQFEACFDDLHAQFGEPSNWACFDDVADCIQSLRAHGQTIAIASNFDSRLHSVLNGLIPLADVDQRFVSSQIGFRKPAKEFFEAVCNQLSVQPDQVLFVGDDLRNDVIGASRAGCHSAWICRQPNVPNGVPADSTWISSLRQVTEVVQSLKEGAQ